MSLDALATGLVLHASQLVRDVRSSHSMSAIEQLEQRNRPGCIDVEIDRDLSRKHIGL